MKHALITGITGQDGSYLAELLLEKGYKVYGIFRRKSTQDYGNVSHIIDKINVIYADMSDSSSLIKAVQISMPDEVYNLAAQSFVPVSWMQPIYTNDVNGAGVTSLLEAVRLVKPDARVYQASTSELFGLVQEIPQKETTPFYPRSPYGAAKQYAHWISKNYRESYDLHVSCGILFNHESPRRGKEFVTRKITEAVAKIHYGMQDTIFLGNINAKRDWGYSGDYVKAMWIMLQQEKPDDYIVATGKMHSVKEFAERAFGCIGINIAWHGEGVNEVGADAATGKALIKIDPKLYRPAEVELLIGDASKAREKLGWQPSCDFESLVSMMVENDLKLLKNKTV